MELKVCCCCCCTLFNVAFFDTLKFQAEHDVDARPILVTTSASLADAVDSEIIKQLETLPTAATARVAVSRGCGVVVKSIEEAIAASDAVAPEHLEVMTADAEDVARRCNHYGGLFVGTASAEVFGDYGIGPNHVRSYFIFVLSVGHNRCFLACLGVITLPFSSSRLFLMSKPLTQVLPTAGTGRYTGGLSVFTFLRIRTYMNITDANAAQQIVADAAQLARIEG